MRSPTISASTTTGCMNSDTDPRLRSAFLAVVALGLLCAAVPPAAFAAAAPASAAPAAKAPATPAPTPGARPATPAELRTALQRAMKSLAKAEDALHGKDPGEVGLLLLRADEYLDRFQSASGLEALAGALQAAHAAADGSDLTAAGAAVRRARDLMPTVAEYTVLRQGVEAGHAALRAAGALDRPDFLAALDRLEKATLVPVLLGRLREARDGISRGRLAMVRRDMEAGRVQVTAARRACEGLDYAGALSRASFALSVGSELLASNSVIASRDQVQKALRELRHASEVAHDPQRATLEQARAEAADVWKRSARARESTVEAAKLADIARRVETVRLEQR